MTTLLQQARMNLDAHRLSRPLKPLNLIRDYRYRENLDARENPNKAYGKDQQREVKEYEAYRAARDAYDAKRRSLVAAIVALSTPSNLE
jgi:transcription elongation GreA/GreB family factor